MYFKGLDDEVVYQNGQIWGVWIIFNYFYLDFQHGPYVKEYIHKHYFYARGYIDTNSITIVDIHIDDELWINIVDLLLSMTSYQWRNVDLVVLVFYL